MSYCSLQETHICHSVLVRSHRSGKLISGLLIVAISAISSISTACGRDEPKRTLIDIRSDSTSDLVSGEEQASSTGDSSNSTGLSSHFELSSLSSSSSPLTVKVVERLEHDPSMYTQGLEFANGSLFESSGLYGKSALTQIDPRSGQVEKSQQLPKDMFAEGITIVEETVIQLTWRSEVALIYELESLKVIGQFEYEGEGWGLCFDGESLWMSNGTNRLTQRDPYTFDPIAIVNVTLNNRPVYDLNELECHDGLIWSNVWLTDFVVVIDPLTGEVVAHIDASNLRQSLDSDSTAEALNGIAFDPQTGRMVMTGKHWPKIFVVEFEPCTHRCGPISFSDEG